MQRRKEKRNAALRLLKAKFATSRRGYFYFLEVVFLLKAGEQYQYIYGKYIKKKKKKAFAPF